MLINGATFLFEKLQIEMFFAFFPCKILLAVLAFRGSSNHKAMGAVNEGRWNIDNQR